VKTVLLTTALLGTTLLVGSALSREADRPREGDRPAREGQANAPRIDGDWTVVYAEKDGKKLEDRSLTQVTIRNGVLTCQHDGKARSWRLTFQPRHMLWATELSGTGAEEKEKPRDKAPERRDREGRAPDTARPIDAAAVRQGVYIASPEYLCIALDQIRDRRGPAPGTPPAPGDPGVPGAAPVPGSPAAPGAPGLPDNAPVVPGVQGQAAQQALFGSTFVLILKRADQPGQPKR